MQNSLQSREFKAALARAGLTQYRLAVGLGVAPSKVSAFANGHLSDADTKALARRIETHLRLTPGALADTTK